MLFAMHSLLDSAINCDNIFRWLKRLSENATSSRLVRI
jgi:hypothetical protein